MPTLARTFDDGFGAGRTTQEARNRVQAGEIKVDLLDPRHLTADQHAEWDRLAAAARTSNPFVQPWLQQLSLIHCDPARQARLGVVSDQSGAWLGAMPLAVHRGGLGRLRSWTGWSHANQFTGTPLVRPQTAEAFWAALLGWLDDQGALALALANLPQSDPVNRALFALCAESGRPLQIDRVSERAMLSPEAACHLPPKLRRRIEGLERKLEREHGPLAFERTRDPGRIAALIEPFVALEAAGWKGRAGSALASHRETLAFFRDVAEAAAQHGAIEFAVLTAGGRIAALSTQLLCGGMLHGFKATYDEAFASHAPGLLLLARMSHEWTAAGGMRVDSCARPGQEPVSKLWPGRVALADCRVALGGPLRRTRFAALLRAEAIWHAAKQTFGAVLIPDKA